MIYAPILIPTLNRIEHLQRCITSLQNNAWAKYTTLIISVDYPPGEKYIDGYKKVCEYLQYGISGFAYVDIIYQKENLGMMGNALFVQDYAKKKFDCFIWTEDDNEMSPNFIEYMDKGLEEFRYDDSIIAICSFEGGGNPEDNKSNIALSQNFSAHGYGIWFKKYETIQKSITRKNFLAIAKNNKSIFKLYQYDYSLLFTLQHAIYRDMELYCLPDGEIPWIDMTTKIYTVLNDKYVVCPRIKKIRNWGYDGSGVNCLMNKMYNAGQEFIDQNKEFSFHYMNPMWIHKNHKKRTLEMEIRSLVAFIKLKIWLLLKRG